MTDAATVFQTGAGALDSCKQRVDVIASPGDTIQIDQFLASHAERLRLRDEVGR